MPKAIRSAICHFTNIYATPIPQSVNARPSTSLQTYIRMFSAATSTTNCFVLCYRKCRRSIHSSVRGRTGAFARGGTPNAYTVNRRVTCLLGRVTQAGVFSCVRHVRPLPPLFVWSLLLLLRLHCCRCTRTLTSVRRSHNNSTRANAHSHSCVHTVARLHLAEWVLFCISCACVFCYQLQNQTGSHPIAPRAVSCLSRYQCSSCVRACTDWPVRVCARQCVICNK